MKNNREINQQVLNTSVDKKGRPTINLDKRKSIYESVTEALRAIPVTNRNVGLTIPIYNGVKVVEYWWEKGIKDSDFVKKIDSENIPRINSTLVSLQKQIDSIFSFEFKVVLSLPEKGKSGIIYVVPAAEPTSTNIYDEYFWIESAQTYERWGGVDPEGDIVINNAFTFNENHFNIVEQYGIQNVSLKCDLLDVTSTGFNIYKLAVGEDDNEILLSAEKISRSSAGASSYGGEISLNGKSSVHGRGTTTFGSIFSFSTLSLNSDNNGASKLFLAQPNYLKIADDTNYIELSGDNIAVYSDDVKIFDLASNKLNAEVDKVLIKAVGDDGFNINYDDDFGIKGFLNNNTKKLLLYTPNNKIIITDNNIELNVAEDSYIKLNYDNFNATFNQLIYLNAPITKVKKVLFEQGNNVNIYLESYHNITYGVTYHGLKASSNIYLFDNNYNIIKSNGYELTSYELNAIKYRISSTPTGLGNNIISWNTANNYPVLNIGKDNDICIENNKITIAKANCSIEIDDVNHCIYLYNSNNKIIIHPDNIKFKLGDLFIIMTSDGISDGTNTKTWAQLLS